MKVDFEGKVYDLDTAHIRFRQAETIQDFTGLSIADWEDSLGFEEDEAGNAKNPPKRWIRSVTALYWLMLDQAGEKIPIEDVDPDYAEFFAAVLQATLDSLRQAKAEAERRKAEAEAVDPTRPSQTESPGSPTSDTPTTTTLTPRDPGEAPATASS